MTKEERIEGLHLRMKIHHRRREKRLTALLGAACLFPAVGLLLLAAGGGGQMGSPSEMYTGSAMLFGNSGGYVLIGVVAFLIGVVFTVIIQKYRENKGQETQEDKGPDPERLDDTLEKH